jgi:ABC-type glycerol-3-phosphate transport system substrate-binding protein
MLMVVLFLLAATACAPDAAQQPVPTLPAATNTPVTPTVAPSLAAPTQTPAATETGPQRLTVWWPEPLAPLDNDTAAEVLSQQLSAFQRESPNVSVELRLKQVTDVGGIMSTLRTASAVAPGALPDLTLLRRDDLLVAAQAGIIQPLGGRLSPAVLEDLQTIGIELGSIGGELYGLPYTLDMLHVAYPPSSSALPSTSYDTLLSEQIPFLFTAGRTSGINNVLLLQYLADGGMLSDRGSLVVDADALRRTLSFYEQAVELGVVDPIVLEYVNPSDYIGLLAGADKGLGVVSSTLYLQLLDSGIDLRAAAIPNADGSAETVVDGWMWVLTTSDADRQTQALRFLNWMMDANRQAGYSAGAHMLPSQRSALRQIAYPEYASFAAELLNNAILPLTEAESGAAARAMQTALATVLTGQRRADDATRDVMNQFGN